MITMVFVLLFAHFVADFILQTHWQASNKSKNWWALSAHVLTYTAAMTAIVGSAMILIPGIATLAAPVFLGWVVLNAGLHFATDAVTSRISSKLFGKDWHNFFVVIGADQLIHYFTLIGTFLLFL